MLKATPSGQPDPACLYRLDDGLYVNLTNRCTLACTFCPRTKGDFRAAGHDLRLSREPTGRDVIGWILDGWPFGKQLPAEIVFCGMGEPTLRWEEAKALAWLARRLLRGIPLRLNTDGLASLRQGHDVTREVVEHFDEVSVSLNAPDGATYARICPNRYGATAHEAAVQFLRSIKRRGGRARATVVALPGLDVDACQRLADEIGVPLLVRPMGEIAPHPFAGEAEAERPPPS